MSLPISPHRDARRRATHAGIGQGTVITAVMATAGVGVAAPPAAAHPWVQCSAQLPDKGVDIRCKQGR